MGTYAVTGSASGMGHQVAQKLRDAGHTVIGVDIKQADIVADLSTGEGRQAAAAGVLAASGSRLDGAVLAAGLGPTRAADRARLIAQVNYLGVVELLDAWRPALAAADRAKVVVFSSNSTTTTPMVPARTVRAFLAHDAEKAVRSVRFFGKNASVFVYAASKIAVSRWVRREAVRTEWAGAGIRLNALAPGAIMTPLLEESLSTPKEAKRIRSFPVPIGGFGDAGQLADWVLFMLSDAADFLCGSVLFVDGGSDAYFRADDWPRPRAGVSTVVLPQALPRLLRVGLRALSTRRDRTYSWQRGRTKGRRSPAMTTDDMAGPGAVFRSAARPVAVPKPGSDRIGGLHPSRYRSSAWLRNTPRSPTSNRLLLRASSATWT